jgi:cell wall-associated NlpC family hydrolase
MNRFLSNASLLIIVLIISSCSSVKEYGSRHDRFSSDRIAHFDNSQKHGKNYPKSKTRNRNDRTIVASNSTRVSKTAATKSNTTYNSSKKARYHNERNGIIREANKYQGISYVYGGKTPEKGFDCSGYVSYVYQNQGIFIQGNADHLSKMGRKKDVNDLVPGDLVFFGNGSHVNHVGIVTVNNGKNLSMIHSSSSKGIQLVNITHSDYWRPKLMHGADIISSFYEEELKSYSKK